jgi:thiosulfate dehydrogenase
MVDDQVLTLTDRINGCMRRSLNGKDLPSEAREMEAIIAYLKFAGHGSPEGVRVAGMGLRPIANPASPPDARRGEEVYAKFCATCHKEDGQGEPKPSPGVGYSIPPLWGEASFNAGAGMAKTAYAASYIHDNMPMGVNYLAPLLTVQQAWHLLRERRRFVVGIGNTAPEDRADDHGISEPRDGFADERKERGVGHE